MANPKKKGIFCLETDWWGVKDTATVEPIFRMLQLVDKVPYIHRDIGTREEFTHYLKKWMQRGLSKYPILYLGFHGEPGMLLVGEGRGQKGQVTLDELADLLEDRCKGKVIHFGSCSTLGIHGKRLNTFLKRTGALAVMGFKKPTDWIDAAAFDLLLLGELQHLSMTRPGIRALEKRIRKKAPGLVRELDFRVVVS